MVASRKRKAITGVVKGVQNENEGLRVWLESSGKKFNFYHKAFQYRRGQFVTVTGVVLGDQLLEVRHRNLHPITVSSTAEVSVREAALVKYLTSFRDNCVTLGRSGHLLVDAYEVTVNRRGRIRVDLGNGKDTGYHLWVKPIVRAIIEAQDQHK